MSVSELNKQKVLQFFQEVLNRGRLDLIDELVANDFLGRLTCIGPAITGPDGMRRFVSGRRDACRDISIRVEDQIAEDDRVVTRWRATFSAGSTTTVAPAGAWANCAGITITRLLAGKQVDAYTHCDRTCPARPTAPSQGEELVDDAG
jgi:predicted ester cyclase